MKTRSFTVILHKEDDMYIAECPEVGTVDQGETIEQAIAGLKEATRLYLEEFSLTDNNSGIEVITPMPDMNLNLNAYCQT
jgi:predicted RNase H-like HicB family nuclease